LLEKALTLWSRTDARRPALKGKRIGIVISGGNIDLERLCSLVAGRWALGAGRWALGAGRWSLVAGRWSLVAA
jgi:threonine dehydratase